MQTQVQHLKMDDQSKLLARTLYLKIQEVQKAIDEELKLDLWYKLFQLMANPIDNINVTLDELNEFFSFAAAVSVRKQTENLLALGSQFIHPTIGITNPQQSDIANNNSRVYNAAGINRYNPNNYILNDYTSYQSDARKFLRQLISAGTIYTNQKVGDFIKCMLYLSTTRHFAFLYQILKTSFDDDYETMPSLTNVQVGAALELLREITNLTTDPFTYDTLRCLKVLLGQISNSYVARIPNVTILNNKDSKLNSNICKIDVVIAKKTEYIKTLRLPEIQFYKYEHKPNPELFEAIMNNLENNCNFYRMISNSENNRFYNAYESFSYNNCEFDIDDYNNRSGNATQSTNNPAQHFAITKRKIDIACFNVTKKNKKDYVE